MIIISKMRPVLLIAICLATIVLHCAMGGSAEQGNARITGSITGVSVIDPTIEVQLVPQEYNPFDRRNGSIIATTTDSSGNYVFEQVPFGTYYLFAFDRKHAYTLLEGPYIVIDDLYTPQDGILQKASVVAIAPENRADDGNTTDSLSYFFIRGTSIVTEITDIASGQPSVLNGVPAGIRDVMHYAPAHTSHPVLYTEGVEIMPDDSVTVSYLNRPPRILEGSLSLPPVVYVDTAYSINFYAEDPDSDTVYYSLGTTLQACSFDTLTGIFSWTPYHDEINLQQITFAVYDSKGARSVLQWMVEVRDSGKTPAPLAPTGTMVGRIDSLYQFETESLKCQDGPALYRFSWGDGDTSGWTESLSAQHSWKSSGMFQVGVQVVCADYARSSEWSLPLYITVNKNQTTVPSLIAFPDTIMWCDTISSSYYDAKYDTTYETVTIQRDSIVVEVTPASCDGAPWYQLYLNGEGITDWLPSPITYMTPSSIGIGEISAAAWCDTSVSVPSELSKPDTIVVKRGVLPSPRLNGDTTYILIKDTVSLDYDIISDTYIDTIPILHRLRVYNKYFTQFDEDSNTVIAQIIMTCTDNKECIDTIHLRNDDTTALFADTHFVLQLLYPTIEFYELSIQAECSGGMALSPWGYRYITNKP